MPPTTQAAASLISVMVKPTLVPTGPIIPTPQAVPLPQQQSPTAPHFYSKTPMTLCTYLSGYESLAEAAQLTPSECLAQSTCYLTGEDKDDWENLPEYDAISRLDCFQGSPSYHQPIWGTWLNN